tara:strand:+ start:1137 stop:1556 length:420 start_codon:yes stop_codon:yes gene_type:complete
MAYDNTLPAGGPGNFSAQTVKELEGVEIAFVNVDFVEAMNGETTDPRAAANTGGLELAKQAIMARMNILGEGSLKNSNTSKVYMVRADALDTQSGTTTIASLQTDLRALDALTPDKVTADVTGALVTTKDLTDTSESVS